MKLIMVDIEADGPIPGDYSMIEIGAVLVDDPTKTFHAKLYPISDRYVEGALASIGMTREQTLTDEFKDPQLEMERFEAWIEGVCGKQRPGFISDNNGFDWMFVCWYFHHFIGGNPFGYSSTNLGSLFKGMERSMFVNFKHLRKTVHDHNPVNDAMGNVEALLEMKRRGLKI